MPKDSGCPAALWSCRTPRNFTRESSSTIICFCGGNTTCFRSWSQRRRTLGVSQWGRMTSPLLGATSHRLVWCKTSQLPGWASGSMESKARLISRFWPAGGISEGLSVGLSVGFSEGNQGGKSPTSLVLYPCSSAKTAHRRWSSFGSSR